jgi:hypothetical protein
MLSPLSLDLAAQEFVRERLRQASHQALVNELRASSAFQPRFAWARSLAAALGPRQRVADGLRALACRLDPTVARCDPPLAVLKVR